MKIFRAYKTELDPTTEQAKLLLCHAGAARWAYNWGLARKQESYAAWVADGKRGKCSVPSMVDLHRELVILKKKSQEDGGVPWMYGVSKWAPQEALRNLDMAYVNFFRRGPDGSRRKGFPRFKSRKTSTGCFTVTLTHGAVNDAHVKLPRIGKVRLKEQSYLPTDGVRITSTTVSEKAGRWFVALRVEQECKLAAAPGCAANAYMNLTRDGCGRKGATHQNA